jgi:hypothetical protein
MSEIQTSSLEVDPSSSSAPIDETKQSSFTKYDSYDWDNDPKWIAGLVPPDRIDHAKAFYYKRFISHQA